MSFRFHFCHLLLRPIHKYISMIIYVYILLAINTDDVNVYYILITWTIQLSPSPRLVSEYTTNILYVCGHRKTVVTIGRMARCWLHYWCWYQVKVSSTEWLIFGGSHWSIDAYKQNWQKMFIWNEIIIIISE